MMNKPVSLYIHIPFCKSKCPYCDFYSARPEEDDVFDRYLAALCARLAVCGEKYGERLLHTVYFGGGTPSVFGAKRLCRVLEKVKEQFNVAENAEITRGILDGKIGGGARNACLLNAAAGIVVGGKTDDFGEAVELAKKSLDSGAARAKLDVLVKFSRQ